MDPKDADGMANTVGSDQTAPFLGLQCLLSPIYLRIKTYYDIADLAEMEVSQWVLTTVKILNIGTCMSEQTV